MVERLEALLASYSTCSCVGFIDEALVAEVNKFPNPSLLSSLGLLDLSSWLLRMLLHDNLLEISTSAKKDHSGKEVVAMTEELEPLKTLELACIPKKEVLDSLPSKFINFNSFVGMLVEKFEKEINSMLKKLELKKCVGLRS